MENHLILVGVDEYQDSRITRLYNCKEDCEKFKNVLINNYKGFDLSRVHSFYNEDATKDNITSFLDELRKKANSKMNCVFYFACHGYAEKTDKLYLIMHDSVINSLHSSYLSFNTIYDFMEGSSHNMVSKKKINDILIILDVCHGALGGVNSNLMELKDKGEGISRTILSSTNRSVEVSDKSIFNFFLIEILRLQYSNSNKFSCKTLERRISGNFEYVKSESLGTRLTRNQEPGIFSPTILTTNYFFQLKGGLIDRLKGNNESPLSRNSLLHKELDSDTFKAKLGNTIFPLILIDAIYEFETNGDKQKLDDIIAKSNHFPLPIPETIRQKAKDYKNKNKKNQDGRIFEEAIGAPIYSKTLIIIWIFIIFLLVFAILFRICSPLFN